MICDWSQRFRNSAFIYIHRRSMSVNWSMCRTIINKYGFVSVQSNTGKFCFVIIGGKTQCFSCLWSSTMRLMRLLDMNMCQKETTLVFIVNNSGKQPPGCWLLIMIVLLLYLRVMSGCTTGLSVCSHRHLISELQGRSQSVAPFHSTSLFLFSIFFSAAAASPDSVTCPPVWLVTNKVCRVFSCAEHRWQAH